MKVLLIGNGSSVLDHELGKHIDSEFDLVFRINRFKIKGFEKNVGTRTDGWVIADTGEQWLFYDGIQKFGDDVEGISLQHNIDHIFINIPQFKLDRSYAKEVNNFVHGYNLYHKVKRLSIINPVIEDNILSEVKTKFPKNSWPTTGLSSIRFLLEIYNNLYIYGFDGMSKKYKYYHYFDKEDNRTTEHAWTRKPEHNFEIETEYINSLRKDGKLIDINEEMFK